MAKLRRRPNLKYTKKRRVTDEAGRVVNRSGDLDEAVRRLKAAGLPAYGDTHTPIN